jgi:hypothetical protein
LFLGLFTRSNVTIFVTVLLSACLDFWVTKNVTGRYLIGLRWWSTSEISSDEDLDDSKDDDDEEKKEEWYFESYPYDVSNSMLDVNIFWFSQCGTAIFWSIFLVLKTLGLSLFWGMLVFVCWSLSTMNLYAFYLARQGRLT